MLFQKAPQKHQIVECRTLFKVKCGTCGKVFDVLGARHDDLSAFDLEYGEETVCTHCGAVALVLTGDPETDALLEENDHE